MAMPKVLQQMRQSLKNTGKNVITDGSIGLQDSDTGAHFNLEIQSTGSNTVSASFENDNNINVKLKNIADPTDLNDAATKNYVDIKAGSIDTSTLLPKSGGTMTGPLTLANDPTGNMQAATKQYVDNSGGTFYATYGTTTYQEIVNAFNAGKTCKALYSNNTYAYIFDLVTKPTGSNEMIFVSNRDGYSNTLTSPYTCIQVNSNSSWSIYNGNSVRADEAIYRNGTTTITSSTGYYRPIRASLAPPSPSDGYVGDVWVVYKNA